MLPESLLDRFIQKCPAVVMVRATLENLLRPERLDQIFEQAAQRQYTKQLLFSEVVAVMAAVATRAHRSVHAAYLACRQQVGVSAAALYEKLNHLEPNVSAALIQQTAADAAEAIDAMPAGAVLAYTIYAVVKAALRVAHGRQTIQDRLSDYHLMDHVAQTHTGLEIAVDPQAWQPYQQLSTKQLGARLVELARQVDLTRYPKNKCGPKKPRPPRKSGAKDHHVAIARLLAAQKETVP